MQIRDPGGLNAPWIDTDDLGSLSFGSDYAPSHDGVRVSPVVTENEQKLGVLNLMHAIAHGS
jgi:hypothetical protein